MGVAGSGKGRKLKLFVCERHISHRFSCYQTLDRHIVQMVSSDPRKERPEGRPELLDDLVRDGALEVDHGHREWPSRRRTDLSPGVS